MDAALKLIPYPALVHWSLCVHTPISFFVQSVLSSHATSPCFPAAQMLCYSIFLLNSLLSILKSCFGGCIPFHIFSFCRLPLSVGHLIFLLESLGYHYSKSCYEGGVLLFLTLVNIIYHLWITAMKIWFFCSPLLFSISSSESTECWLFLKVWNMPSCFVLQTQKPFQLSAVIAASLIMETVCLHRSVHLII